MTEQGTDLPRKQMAFWLKSVIWIVVSLVMGTVGGYVAEYLTAPFYFGFFFTWVLTGLIAMFALAVHVTNEQNPRNGK